MTSNKPTVITKEYERLVVDTCVMAATIMIESGSEMTRVNDTVQRIAHNAGLNNSNAYITITGIVMSGSDKSGAVVGAINKRSFDMEKVAKVNELSRAFAADKISINDFHYQLKHIDDVVSQFPAWLLTVAAGIVSATLVVVFRDNIKDFWSTFVVGSIGWIVYYFLSKYAQIKFLSEFISAVAITFGAITFVRLGLGFKMDDIIVGALMPLVPGIPLTNSVRDTLYGNLISGPARGIESLISACALGFGVAVSLKFF